MRDITIDDSLIGRHATVTRRVVAMRHTLEWTGTRVWSGQLTGAHRDAETGELAAVCMRTADEHTWLSLREEWDRASADGSVIVPASPETAERHWLTRIEFAPVA